MSVLFGIFVPMGQCISCHLRLLLDSVRHLNGRCGDKSRYLEKVSKSMLNINGEFLKPLIGLTLRNKTCIDQYSNRF